MHGLREAAARLLDEPGTRETARSSIYETEPVGVKPEHRDKPYLNAVLIVESTHEAPGWLEAIHRIETDLGRVREADRNAPRTIDIDILYCGNEVIDGRNLVVPHPRWAQRRFVVEPLAEVRPELVLPGAGCTVREILERLPPEPAVRKLADRW